MTNSLFGALFSPHAGRFTPFLHLQDGQTISHAAFLAEAAQYANTLDVLGVQAGDRVAVHVQKSAQALALYAACVQAGAVFLALSDKLDGQAANS